MKQKFKYTYYFRPGFNLESTQLSTLVNELRQVAIQCFPVLPNYQALSGDKKILDQCVIIIARDNKGIAQGFCSSLLLDVPNIGKLLHLGLTCVSPKARGEKLTHKLTSKLIFRTIMKNSMSEYLWISNLACVISSLANVALYFEDVYPSRNIKSIPSREYLEIVNFLDQNYRKELAINKDARLDQENFVFQGSVKSTEFEKEAEDEKFHHRNEHETNFYKNLIDFDRGDEIIQVGRVRVLTFAKYLKKQKPLKKIHQRIKVRIFKDTI